MAFEISFFNVLITLFYIIPGFIICKMKRASADHLPTMSAALVYICSPCMIISSFLSLDFSVSNLMNMGMFFVITLILQSIFMTVIFLIIRKKHSDSRYRMLTISSVFGNVGFFGLPMVKALLPDNPEVLCYSSIYVLSMNLLAFTIGVFCLTENKRYMTLKAALINPTTFGFVIAFPLHLLSAKNWLPGMLSNSINLLGTMTTPLCMIILGIRLANIPFKKLFCRPFIYLICLMKLIIFPIFCYAAVYLLPLSSSFKASILILSATPCAAIISNLAEMHQSETELAANCVLVTTLLSFLTLPVLTLLL